MTQFSLFSLPIHIGKLGLWIILFLVMAGTLAATSVFFYHWKKFGMGARPVLFVQSVHVAMVAIAFVLLIVLVISY